MTNRLINPSPLNTDLAILFLRLTLAGLMIYHGWSKIQGYDMILPRFKDVIGIGSKLSLNLVIFAEFFCAILVGIGLFTRFAVVPILFTMVVIFFIAHGNDPFGKRALPFTYMLICLPIFILGSGKYSVDRLIFKKKNEQINDSNYSLDRKDV